MDDDQIRSKQKQIRGDQLALRYVDPLGSPYVFAFVFKLIIKFIILKTMKVIKNIFQLIILPIILAGVFFVWSLPRITTDYNFNTDELIYLGRSNYWDAYKSGDFNSSIWSSWEVYDQPQLTNYIFAQIPGDRSLLSNSNSPCTTNQNADHYNAWGCLDGKPINAWPSSTRALQSFVTKARTLATAISSLAIMTTYYLGLLVSGPLTGVLAVLYLGAYSFFRGLSTMVMEDQTLLLFLNLQFITTLTILRSKNSHLLGYLVLGLVTGLSFATKLSAIIPTLIIYSYLTVNGLVKNRHNFAKVIISAIFSALIFLGLHPFLWSNPMGGMFKMIEWRNIQIASHAGSPTELKTLADKVTYSLNESFSSFRGDPETVRVVGIAVIALISLLILFFTSPHFAVISTLIALTFVVAIPLNWARYLLPIIPAIAVTIGSFPTLLLTFIQKATNYIKANYVVIKQFFAGALSASLILSLIFFLPTGSYLSSLILVLTIFLTIQGYLVTRAMLHGFSARQTPVIPNQSPKYGFSLILPARDEAEVISHTINSLANLSYPKDKFEVLVMIRADDYETINAANHEIASTDSNVRVIPIDGDANNKAYSLNLALHLASHDVVGIFDAEDEPSREILSKVNDYLLTHKDSSAVQAPVHLTNLTSSWYATLSAVEYYYWFASVLPYLSTKQIVPLGGNTIFIKKEVYKQVGSYDEACLTEDADLGIRLAAHNVKVGILTDPALATREEVPPSEFEVIRQRARWDQGYLQVLDKSYWQYLKPRQKRYALYTLAQPLFRHLSFLNMVFAPLLASLGTIPIALALGSIIPGYFLLLQLGLYLLGVKALSRLHNVKVGLWQYVVTLLVFVPYQALLALGTLRALSRLFAGNFSWDKTSHTNAHRKVVYPELAEGLY